MPQAAGRCDCSGARTRTGVMWMWGELAYADVCGLSEEGESQQLSLACSSSSSSYLPPFSSPPSYSSPPSLLRERRRSGTPRSGWALRPGYKTRWVDVRFSPTCAFSSAGFGCYSLSLEDSPDVGDDTHKHTALCLWPGPFSLLRASAHPQTDAQPRRPKRAPESPHRARDQIRQCSTSLTRSSLSSPHLGPFFLPLLVPPLLHTIGGGIHNHTRAHEDRRHERAEARTNRHALRRCRGAEAEWQRTAWKRSLEWRTPGSDIQLRCSYPATAKDARCTLDSTE
ncbi:hypothetical protein DFH08DRAFT_332269 [Mycena albidolilacea]|uniref:Uncharacterized protein n=1 Tax=Mycena albidolilacea TaxID=1033008 RepID=A0AAD7EIM4_9AGAR|nr:hypothetical protein DFH08DRAFT_332269 [Mycena albidolilacea]